MACLGVFWSLAGELQGEALMKRAKLKSQLVGREAPRCFWYFHGRVRMLKPRKIGTKCELAARMSLQRGWLPAVLQSSSHQRHFEPKAGSTMPNIGHPAGKGPRGRKVSSLQVCPFNPGENGVQGCSSSQPQSHLPDHNPTPCSLSPTGPIWYKDL